MRLGYGHAHGPQRIRARRKTVSVTFHLDDPHALTDTDQAVWELKAAKGQPLLEVAVHAGINIEHACEGVCAVPPVTCARHPRDVDCSEADEDEEDRVEEAPGLQINSRLCCQAVVEGDGPIVVHVPSWNRNAVKEVPH